MEDESERRALSRRAFLQLVTAAAATAGTACFRSPLDTLVPYVERPPELTPGVGTPYATSFELDGYATGVVVECREGRPIKVEGNPLHPASGGAAGVHEQAALLDLYDPTRARALTRDGEVASWSALSAALRSGAADGTGLHVLLGPTASPLVAAQLARLRERRPRARIHFFEALPPAPTVALASEILGRPLQPLPDLGRARCIVAADCDLFGAEPFALRHAADFAAGRRVRRPSDPMSRLYALGPTPTPTADAADHRLPCTGRAVPHFLAALLEAVLRAEGAPGELTQALAPIAAAAPHAGTIERIAGDLRAHRGEALVVAGRGQPAVAHALAWALTDVLGGIGKTLSFTEPLLADATNRDETLPALVDAMASGAVERLVILEVDPARLAPPALRFADAVRRVRDSVALAPHRNETAALCRWHAPSLHALESWGDGRALDGTVSLVQPLVRPLWEGCTRAELLAALVDDDAASGRALLRTAWAAEGRDAEEAFTAALARGVVEASAARRPAARIRLDAVIRMAGEAAAAETPRDGDVELVFRPDPALHDGRFAANAWLQELPDPVTKLTWENAAWLGPETARGLGASDGTWLRVAREGRSIEIPAIIVPGHAEGSVTLLLGFGPRSHLPASHGGGVDVTPLVPAGLPLASGLVTRVEGRPPHRLARTQQSQRQHDRSVARERTRESLEAAEAPRPLDAFYAPPQGDPPQWAMTVDLTVCTGCSACVVACQAENDVPVVGRDEILRGREMHWLRIDRYAEGGDAAPRTVSQPMLCQQCELAPCEYVCPVEATVHSRDGLNDMVYNRCVGTRFCSNNCPYKVRRFNWRDYQADVPEVTRLQRNPDVTVRARGVMEKCTYCVQRIRRAQIRARRDARPLEDGEVRTACQQTCPTRAITFGSIADAQSAVSRTRAAPQAYAVLEELGTRPRTMYLARVRNPLPGLGVDG
ncbi:MAG TPA: 4Fe-4S dicluster domain-containing protein [Myxococcota bacterium]|nr:4Fe-4S dicluster domain-containing protein [Myxococcota bacterium]